MASVASVRPRPVAGTPRGPVFSILDAYILRELWGPFLFGLGAFFLFWFVNIFFLAADYIVNMHAPIVLVLRFLMFRVPQSTPMAFPFACLFATLLAFGRLVADNEIAALRTSGVPFMRIARVPIVLGFGVFLVSYLINEHVTPKSVDLSTRTFYQIIYHTESLPISPQFFRRDPSSGKTFYVGQVLPDSRTMLDVQIFEPQHDGSAFQQVLTAKQARIENGVIHIDKGEILKFKPSGTLDGEVSADNVTIGLPLGENVDDFLTSSQNDPYSLTSQQLRQRIATAKMTGDQSTPIGQLQVALADKLAYPFGSFIAVIIALPLAVFFGKRGRELGIALSLVMLFVYYLLHAMTVAFGRNGAIDPNLAAWLPNILLGLTGAGLLYWEDQ